MSNYYFGTTPEFTLGDSPRYLYAIRRNEDGEIFFIRSDQLVDKDIIAINKPGPVEDNFEDFEPGINYFEGIGQDHELTTPNLIWTQYRWDNRSILYYVDEEGQLTQRINFTYEYPEGVSDDDSISLGGY